MRSIVELSSKEIDQVSGGDDFGTYLCGLCTCTALVMLPGLSVTAGILAFWGINKLCCQEDPTFKASSTTALAFAAFTGIGTILCGIPLGCYCTAHCFYGACPGGYANMSHVQYVSVV